MTNHIDFMSIQGADLDRAIDLAIHAIPPAWPLEATVAVNPFLGQSAYSLAEASTLLNRVAGCDATMGMDWYRAKIDNGEISDAHLAHALAEAPEKQRPKSIEALKKYCTEPPLVPKPLPTIADLASEISGIDWPRLIDERIGHWVAGYFDNGQALWASPKAPNAYLSWRSFATHDLTPEIAGLRGFATYVSQTPMAPEELVEDAVTLLGLDTAGMQTYFQQLLMTLGGWAQHGRYLMWQADLNGLSSNVMVELLAVRMVWEAALFEQYRNEIADAWDATRNKHAEPVAATTDSVVAEILQTAYEFAGQERLSKILAAPVQQADGQRPLIQAAFCIDVRSELLRRHLESLDDRIQTIGFAGFFGAAVAHKAFASDVVENRLPVLLKPSLSTTSTTQKNADADIQTRYKARAKRAWGRFKLAAVSSFAFVEAAGPLYGFRILRDGLGLKRVKAPNGPLPVLDQSLSREQRIEMAKNILQAMTLTGQMARLVVIVGHGASVVNNPQASALQCGACGGHSGEVNARVVADLLNNMDVRAGLVEHGINIPRDTVFLAGRHDTTTDTVTLYDNDRPGSSHISDIRRAADWFEAAGSMCRTERAIGLPHANTGNRLYARARDWSEVRPEWGLSGCQAFIVAPRHVTRGKDLSGRVFLHEYNAVADTDYSILELIMTAPVVVASWISLQYYGSTVLPTLFGAGNKLLHNVVGGIGVLEGNGGRMRTGLSWQSVHDGSAYNHEPRRLMVCVTAPRDAVTAILEKHETVRQLFDNKWLHLFVLDDNGSMVARYKGNLEWTSAGEL